MEHWAKPIAESCLEGGGGTNRCGLFIRGYLQNHGEGNPYGMWKAYRLMLEEIGWNPPTYNSFRRFVWICKKLGLIKPTRKGRGTGDFKPQFYALVATKARSRAWADPVGTKYPRRQSGTRS